jgi:HEPN domain-containing protein
MSVPPEVVRAARRWVEKAEEDLRNAEYTLTLRNGCPFATVCFHAQQCAEKYLKALLTLHSIPFPKTHDLAEILLLVPKHVHLALPAADLERLSEYAVEARYPGDWTPFDRSEAERAVALAQTMRAAVRDTSQKGHWGHRHPALEASAACPAITQHVTTNACP